ncbi:hypothetical protein, partial [Neisseria meningitidis]|uniref:hypothetical protein n=1 Tax=Neisseria meningitidis TaxID=487 RepID=UPI001C58F78A
GQLRVAHGNLSCRKGRMLPHTGLFLLGKVALQMRIRQSLNIAVVLRSRFPPYMMRSYMMRSIKGAHYFS